MNFEVIAMEFLCGNGREEIRVRAINLVCPVNACLIPPPLTMVVCSGRPPSPPPGISGNCMIPGKTTHVYE